MSVWVPSEQDAEDVRMFAKQRRERAEELKGMSEVVPAVTPSREARIAKAIAEHGAAAYTTPSGAVLELMTELADEGDLEGFSQVVIWLARPTR